MKIIDQAKSKTKLYAIIPDLTYAVRGGRIDPSKKRITDLLNITPILTLSENGTIKTAGIRFGKKNLDRKIANFVLKRIDYKKSYKVLVAHGNDHHGGEKLLETLSKNIPNLNSAQLVDVGGVFGVHVGPNTLAVAIQEELPR